MTAPRPQHLKETKDGVGSVYGLVCRDVVRPDVISKRGLLPEVPDPALDDLLGGAHGLDALGLETVDVVFDLANVLFVLVVDDLAQFGVQIAGLERVGLFRRDARDLRAGRDRASAIATASRGRRSPSIIRCSRCWSSSPARGRC